MATAKRLPSGKYSVLEYIEKVDGERKYKRFTALTKAQAEYDAAMYKFKRKKVKASGITVGEAIDRYIASKDSVLSPKTIREYLNVRNIALQGLMPVLLPDLTNEAVQVAINEYSKGHSPKTVRNAAGLLSAALKMHHPEFLLRVSLPQRVKTEISIPDDGEIKRLLDAVAGTPMHTAILLAAALGLRRSELCAMEWSDINDKQGTVRISKAMVINADGVWITKTTKTTSSTRVLEIPEFLMEHLRKISPREKRVVDICNPNAVTYRFVQLRNKLGLSVRFHDLRHYYASMLLALGIPNRYAMARMGHATPNMLTTVYQHLTSDKQRQIDAQISEKLDSIFSA